MINGSAARLRQSPEPPLGFTISGHSTHSKATSAVTAKRCNHVIDSS